MEKPISILHVVISLDTGGLERFVLDLIEANKNVFNQFVVCLERAGELSKTCKAEVISMNMPPGLHLRAAWDIAKIVRDKKVDIIHTHNEKAQLYGGIAGLLARVPVVHTKHGKNETGFFSVLRNSLMSRLCRNVITVSRDAAVQCINDENIPIHKVATILNGINTNTFSRFTSQMEARIKLGIELNVPVIGIVARLAPVKDHATLMVSCRQLKDKGAQFRLLVVGDGPLRGELENLASSLGIHDRVNFLGVRTDIPSLMQSMDLFVLSSTSEGISLTLVEAMACELPVVATEVGGNPEVIVEGETGFLVPPQNSELMAERISQLLENPQLRQQLGKNGRKRAECVFSLSRAALEYANLYRMVLDRNPI